MAGGPGPRVSVIGAGSWGTTFAALLAPDAPDAPVVLWARRADVAAEITATRINAV